MFFHGNAAINRANELAQVTAHTFFFLNAVSVVRISSLDIDRLMRCVFTYDVTKATVNTFILVDVGNMVIVDIEIFPMRNFFNAFANKIGEDFKALFIHPVIKAFA